MAKPLRPPLTTLVPLFGMESSKFARPVGDGDGAKPRTSSREAAAMYADVILVCSEFQAPVARE